MTKKEPGPQPPEHPLEKHPETPVAEEHPRIPTRPPGHPRKPHLEKNPGEFFEKDENSSRKRT